MKEQYFLMYSDDIVLYANSLDGHIGHVRKALTLFYDAGDTLRFLKCKFQQRQWTIFVTSYARDASRLRHVRRTLSADVSHH